MTEFNVEVVRLDQSEKHPNADSLSITHIFGGYPVVYRTENFKQGDKLVYIPIDSLVPLSDSRFAFLSEDEGKKTFRIKAKKLRGIFSMGMLVPADEEWEIGENVQEKLGIVKWEPPPPKQFRGSFGPSDQESDPGVIPMYTDLDSLRKYKSVFADGEEVILTEKIHGANARFVWSDDRLWVGSHKQFKKENENNAWWKIAKQYNLGEILNKNPDVAIYGEMYGTVQDLRYGAAPGDLMFAAFDVMDAKTGRYYKYDDFKKFCDDNKIPTAPELYRGPWSDDLKAMANGKSTIADHVREGFVARSVDERWNDRVGRVVLKLVGQDYLLRKNA